jgi:hypothetical protein
VHINPTPLSRRDPVGYATLAVAAFIFREHISIRKYLVVFVAAAGGFFIWYLG